jgi:hypothetical protein
MTAVIQDIHKAHRRQSVLAKHFLSPNEPGAALRDSSTENSRRRTERQRGSTTLDINPNNIHMGTNTCIHICTPVRHTPEKLETCREMGKGHPHRAWSDGPGYSQNNGLSGPLPERATSRGHAVRPSNELFP